MDRVQFSPSVGNKNLSEPATPQRPEQAATAPAAPAPEPVESDVAQDGPRSPVEKAQEQQRKLNNLTLAVRKAVREAPNTQELVRESVGQFIDENGPDPAEKGSDEAYVTEIKIPGSGDTLEIEPAQSPESAPAPEVPKVEVPPAVEQDSGGGDTDGPRGEVVDIVS